jgi:hypothetical protein
MTAERQRINGDLPSSSDFDRHHPIAISPDYHLLIAISRSPSPDRHLPIVITISFPLVRVRLAIRSSR